MALIHVGNLVFVDKDPIEGTTDVYPFVEWQNLHRADYGLAKSAGGPDGEWIEQVVIGQDYFDDARASAWDGGDAVKDAASKYAFEEEPSINFTNRGDYDDFLVARGLNPSDGSWEGAGIYDGRENPPTRSESAEEYEVSTLEWESNNVLESLFQDEERVAEALVELQGE